jgi:lipid kinase YegS
MSRTRDPRERTIALVIHGSRADDPGLRAAVDAVRALGVRIRPRVTFEVGDAATFAREAAEAGVHAVVAVGGDGTVNEVLNGLAGHDVPLGIVPLGTANDFARQVGIPEDAEHALDLILRSEPVRLDSAELNGRRFLNVSAGGIGAEATAETGAAAKAALGPLAYALTGLRKLVALETRPLRFRFPDGERTHDVVLFAVGNARVSGGGMPVTPLASPNDGLLDVCVVERMGRAELARLALKVRQGEHLDESGVFYYRAPWVDVLADEEIDVNVDGERVRATTLRYRSRPGDLRMFLPAPSERPDGERPAGDDRRRAVPSEE